MLRQLFITTDHRMSRASILIFLILCQYVIVGQHQMKVITYNIWNGYEWGKDTARKTQLLKWLSDQDADVVAWQELCSYTEDLLLNDAVRIGHKYAILLKETGYSVGISSKHPIQLREKILDGMHHGALHCVIRGIDFFVVHLSPMSFKKRQFEAQLILDKLRDVSLTNGNYIVLGDFNSHTPFDEDLYKNDVLLNRYKRSPSNSGNNGNLSNGTLDFSVMSKMLSFPLVDVVQQFTSGLSERGSFPGRVLGKINNETDQELIERLERIDFILTSPRLSEKCTSGRVFNTASNWYLSDHYPVMMVLNDVN